MKMVNDLLFFFFECETSKETVLIKNQRLPKNNVEFIENIEWDLDRSREYEYGKWYKIPKKEITNISLNSLEEVYVSVLTYHNVWDKWCFNGLIARLFAGSYDLSNIKQDFNKKIVSNSLLGTFM